MKLGVTIHFTPTLFMVGIGYLPGVAFVIQFPLFIIQFRFMEGVIPDDTTDRCNNRN